MSYTIEKGIPIPGARETNLTATLRGMEVGDSFVFDGNIKSLSTLISRIKTMEGKSYKSRQCEGVYRVWRVA